MILFDQEMIDDFPTFYSKVRISDNQIKSQLQRYFQPQSVFSIRVSKEETITIIGLDIISMIMKQLKRNKIIELIHHLHLIEKRNSDMTAYLKVIILGIILNSHQN